MAYCAKGTVPEMTRSSSHSFGVEVGYGRPPLEALGIALCPGNLADGDVVPLQPLRQLPGRVTERRDDPYSGDGDVETHPEPMPFD